MTLVVGFDLDMTLVDSGPGIAASTIDAELHHWYGDDAPRMADRFRELYIEHGVPGTFIMPGARESIDAVRARDGRVLVVTAKYEPNARRLAGRRGVRLEARRGEGRRPRRGRSPDRRRSRSRAGRTVALNSAPRVLTWCSMT